MKSSFYPDFISAVRDLLKTNQPLIHFLLTSSHSGLGDQLLCTNVQTCVVKSITVQGQHICSYFLFVYHCGMLKGVWKHTAFYLKFCWKLK
uniref:Uncharacterized protein n=1 Tax=Anguilla anguilla TaxID=7936 RepID=A0A0E9X2Z8_ANGAN